MTSMLPRNRSGVPTGALTVRDSEGVRSVPSTVNPDTVYTPPPEFTFSGGNETALPSDCWGRVDPEQVNAIVSELLALMVGLTPSGTFDCNSVTNLADAFAAWVTGHVDTKVSISDIIDNVTSTDVDKPLSANQGRVLKALADTKVSISSIVDSLASTATNQPLSAKQGAVIAGLIDALGDVVDGKQPLNALLTAITGLAIIKGSLIGGAGAGTLGVVNAGPDGQALVADAASPSGMKFAWPLDARFTGTIKSALVPARLDALRITSGTSARFADLYRHRDTISAVNAYFMLSAMTLAPTAFGTTKIKAAVAAALNRMVVSPRANSSAYGQYSLVQFPSGKVFFTNIAGTTAGSAPSDAGVTTAGTFLGDGTVTFEYTGMQVPTSWAWWVADIDNSLAGPQAPDSNDSYAGLLATAAVAGGVDSTWLSAATDHKGLTRLEVIANVIQNSITAQTSGGLSSTFQSNLKADGTSYNVRFLADNVEAWRGVAALASLYTTASDAVNAAARTTEAGTLRTGIMGLWDGAHVNADTSTGRWKIFYGDTDYSTNFVTRSRFAAWPILHGVLTSASDIATYGVPAMSYVLNETPNVLIASLDTFPMSEWYLALKMLGLRPAGDTILRRVTERLDANSTIVDVAVGLVVAGG